MGSLLVRDLSIVINSEIILKTINLNLCEGKIYALLGSNGSGKTMFLKTLAGIRASDPKKILFNDQDLAAMDPLARSRMISMLLQHSPIEPFTSALDRILHGLIPEYGFFKTCSKEALDKAHEIADRLNIRHLLARPLGCLSGGEQRLIYLAKCLVNTNIEFLFLDEPTVYLDHEQKKRLGEFLKILTQSGKLIIFSGHDQGFTKEFSNGLLEIKDRTIRLI